MGKAPDAVGDCEELVLLALRVGNAYGTDVMRALGAVGRAATPGAVFTVLHRLEAKGFLASEAEPPRPIRGGRARRRWGLTEKGREVLRAMERQREQVQGVQPPT